jgi:hypothetical protein
MNSLFFVVAILVLTLRTRQDCLIMSTRKRKENRSSSSSNNNTRIEDDDEGTVITHGADDNDADSSEEGLLADELITNQDEADNVRAPCVWWWRARADCGTPHTV